VQPIPPEQPETAIAHVVVTDVDTGRTSELTTRSDSRCHFFERFLAGHDSVQLRLDWTDLDPNGQPRLDADFLNPETGKHRSLTGERRRAHHTDSAGGDGRYYEWEFADVHQRLLVSVSWSVFATAVARARASPTATVIRAADHEDPEHG
jgi:hypothetical protein